MPGAGMGPFGHEPRNQRHLFFVKKMRHALDRDRFDSRVGDDHFLVTGRSRVAFEGRIDIGPEHLAQPAELRHKPGENFIRLCLCRVAIELVEALGNLRLHPRMESSNAASGHIRQIARIDEGFSVEAGEHQAHQIDAGSFDRRP